MDKLTYRNQWEADEYYVGEKRIHILDEIEYNGVTYPVTTVRMSVPYNDMGHTYHGVSNHFFVDIEVLGVRIKMDLNKIVPKNPKIKATKFVLV